MSNRRQSQPMLSKTSSATLKEEMRFKKSGSSMIRDTVTVVKIVVSNDQCRNHLMITRHRRAVAHHHVAQARHVLKAPHRGHQAQIAIHVQAVAEVPLKKRVSTSIQSQPPSISPRSSWPNSSASSQSSCSCARNQSSKSTSRSG